MYNLNNKLNFVVTQNMNCAQSPGAQFTNIVVRLMS